MLKLDIAFCGCDSYTEKLNTLFLEMGKGKPWALTGMQKTKGYANRPLDALWVRAPYLHNGSVPTMSAVAQNQPLGNESKPATRRSLSPG